MEKITVAGGEREREEKGRWRGSPSPPYMCTHAWEEEEEARVGGRDGFGRERECLSL